ncbi:YfiR family protein [Desulfomarina sp.]
MMSQPDTANLIQWNKRRRLRCILETCLLTFLLLGIAKGNVLAAHPKVFKESQVKAVFLYNLIKFVTRPGSEHKVDPFVIGVLGRESFGSLLSKVVAGEYTGNRKIVVEQYGSPDQIVWSRIDMLFISRGSVPEGTCFSYPAIKNNVLTVGEEAGFCRRGGMINLVTRGSRILIEMNVEQIRKSGFRVSAQVLKLARLVTTVSGDEQ